MSTLSPSGKPGVTVAKSRLFSSRLPSTTSKARMWCGRRGAKEPAVVLGIDVRSSGSQHYFSADGTRYAWGNQDGTVNVADLPEIQRRLAEIGLGWE